MDIEVGPRIGEVSKFRIYLGTMDDGQLVILKVAKTFEDGDILAEEAGKFNILRSFERQITKFETDQGGRNPHYDWLFADLLSSFTEPTLGDRRINVFATPDIDLSKLIPLTKLHAKAEIDTRTGIWILECFLKFYGLFELSAAFGNNPTARYPIFSPDDYLIGPGEHRLIYYSFSGDIADMVANDFIKAISKFILDWTVVRYHPVDRGYHKLLEDFSESGCNSFEEAQNSCLFVKKCWALKYRDIFQYHPFTYRYRDTTIWKSQ